MRNLKIFVLICFCLFCFGCAGFSLKTANSVCDNLPEGTSSVICSTATMLNVTPEAISSIMTISNLSGLVSGVYTAEEAMVVINTMESFVVGIQKTGITYISLIQMALNYYNTLTPKMQAAFVVLQEFIVVPDALGKELLTDYDYVLILKALEKQRHAITPFLASN